MPRCIAIVPLLIVAVNASCDESGVKNVWSEVQTAASYGTAALVEDSSMCQYLDMMKTCDEKATEQDCMLGSDCVWQSKKCRIHDHASYEVLFNQWAEVAASTAGKFFKTHKECNQKKQSDCSNNCEWSEIGCSLASKYYTDMCSNADVKSMAELHETCATMTGTCTGACESQPLAGWGDCKLKRSKLVESMFGDFADTLTTASNEVVTCTTAGGNCTAGCTKGLWGCSKQVHPIMATFTSQSDICQGKKESTQCTSQCEKKDDNDKCTLSVAWALEECKVKGGYIDFAPSSFEPVPILLSIIAMHVAAYV